VNAPRLALAVVVGLCALKALVHLALVDRYGYHGDELYFLECGRQLAWGYVDHPPLVPFLARLADALGGSLLWLRLPAIAAGVGTMALTALLVREWGGGARAQLLALLCLLVAPAHLRMAAMLDIPVVETFLCTLTAWLTARALARDERWTWLLAGGALGLAALTKHSAILWGAALLVGLLASPARRVLASRWPWLGAALAALLFAPNLLWQAQHDFATLQFVRTLRHELLSEQGRLLFVLGQLLYFHPLAVPVWLAGLAYASTREGVAARPFAVLFLGMSVFLLLTGGKPYYLGSAYPPVLAAGGVALERWLARRTQTRRVLTASLAGSGLVLGMLTLPILPLQTVDAAMGALFGWVVPPIALTHDLHGQYGWDEHAATVGRVYQTLPDREREQASVLVRSYAQASAINVLGEGLPRATSGHMTYALWGPQPGRGAVLIAYGLPRERLLRHYQTCVESDRIEAPLARPGDTDLPVYVCRGPLTAMAELWPKLVRFGHTTPASEGADLAR
jgi:hypothetical protein